MKLGGEFNYSPPLNYRRKVVDENERKALKAAFAEVAKKDKRALAELIVEYINPIRFGTLLSN